MVSSGRLEGKILTVDSVHLCHALYLVFNPQSLGIAG